MHTIVTDSSVLLITLVDDKHFNVQSLSTEQMSDHLGSCG